ncbi:hypothetical protein CRUP_026234 [Coryphaenoides rupestris]|nr:hypothetical protein CRUP_026234 [Coryphaenoides rupestris]
MSSSPNCSLQVNTELLDHNFESYRLSLDPIATYNVQLDAAVEEVTLKDSQYTLDHVRAFGMYNYLHLDPWYPDSVFFVDCKGRVLNLTVTLDTALGKPKEVFQVSPEGGCEEPVCPSLSLTSASWAALSDGTGRLYLLRTSQRGENSHLKWDPQFSQEMGAPFVLVHSLAHVEAGGRHSVELLLLRVQKDPLDSGGGGGGGGSSSSNKGSGFSVTLEWVTVADTSAPEDQQRRYEVSKRRLLTGKSVPHYAALEPQGRGLMLASDRPFACTHVDGEALEQPAAAEPMEVEATDPVYFWQQTEEDVTVSLRMPEGFTKDQVLFSLTGDTISVGVRGDLPPILEGPLHAPVTLQKRAEGDQWVELVTGDRRGEYVVSEEQAALIHQRLTHLTADDLVNLGSHQYLFTVTSDPSEMPCLCLRHDVDALVWQPRPERPHAMWEHVATFNALGYVQASKRDKKFSTCAPDFSYAALAECLRRAFIYRQPAPVDTVLFNRKQGRQVGQVAKQQVASLDSGDPVLGFRATNERLFVLTSKSLFVLKINND